MPNTTISNQFWVLHTRVKGFPGQDVDICGQKNAVDRSEVVVMMFQVCREDVSHIKGRNLITCRHSVHSSKDRLSIHVRKMSVEDKDGPTPSAYNPRPTYVSLGISLYQADLVKR
jgi:hypothetical protein